MNFIEILKVIFLGIVEGITEWLPISSTGHMILVDEFINLNVSDEFLSMFFVVIQLGAIFAVLVIYFDKLNVFSKNKTYSEKRDTVQLWLKVIVACLPAAVLGLMFDDWLDEHLYNYQTVATTLIIYGVAFIVLENRNSKMANFKVNNLNQLSYKTAFGIGCFQVLSLIPGTSRSGSTILGAILLGVNRKDAAEFSFFLAIPVMLGASFLKLVKFGFVFTTYELMILLIGMATAFIVSIFAIKFLVGYLKSNDFKVFGWYRIVLGVLVLAYFVASN